MELRGIWSSFAPEHYRDVIRYFPQRQR
jgi:hypothetical protein